MYTIKQIEKAQKIIKKINNLDKLIIDLERMAIDSANGENKLNISLRVTCDKVLIDKDMPVITDEDGSLINPEEIRFYGHQSLYFQMMGRAERPQLKPKDFNMDVEDTISIRIFGLLISDSKIKRNKLIAQLEKIGIQIESSETQKP